MFGAIYIQFMVGVIGFAFLVYAKKERAPIPFICGIALSIIPFFVSNIYWLLASALTLAVIPFLLMIF